ncbi:IS3 family transposase, partial [Ligilactobacillus salitolerans]|uniref:IS3 family transposase n=1 Tax=Ligilactobacillus salitolerans TaxID=1808352 RepID=UPI0011CF6C44
QLENEWLEEVIKSVFNKYNCIYGYRRITGEINRRFNKKYNPKRILRIMRKLGLQSVVRRNRHSCTVPGDRNVTDNILNRNFTSDQPNEKWVTDVTYLELETGKKVYLSAIKDLYDGKIISYQISTTNDFKLVQDTLLKARQA